MTAPQQPIAFTTDGAAVFAVPVVPAGSVQPVGALADGQLVWPVPAGHVPANQPQPLGYLASGQYLYARPAQVSPPLPPVPAAAPSWGPPTAASPASPAWGSQSARPVAPAFARAPETPVWQRKKVWIPAAAVALILAINVSNQGDPAPTEITNAGAETQAAAVKAPAQNKAAQDKARAAKAAADKAAANKAAADKAAAQKAAAAKAAAENGPAEQQALVAAVAAGRDDFQSTDNELKQRQFQKKRDAAAKSAVRGLRVTNWVGEIKDIDTNGGGKGVLELRIGDDTKISTWNNAFSDYDDNTLIPMDSAMYETLVDMQKGDRIRFSGTFFSDAEKGGLKEQSLTLRGQMMTPNFLFRFSKIEAIG